MFFIIAVLAANGYDDVPIASITSVCNADGCEACNMETLAYFMSFNGTLHSPSLAECKTLFATTAPTLTFRRRLISNVSANDWYNEEWASSIEANNVPVPSFVGCNSTEMICTPGPCLVFDYDYFAWQAKHASAADRAHAGLTHEYNMVGIPRCGPTFGTQMYNLNSGTVQPAKLTREVIVTSPSAGATRVWGVSNTIPLPIQESVFNGNPLWYYKTATSRQYTADKTGWADTLDCGSMGPPLGTVETLKGARGYNEVWANESNRLVLFGQTLATLNYAEFEALHPFEADALPPYAYKSPQLIPTPPDAQTPQADFDAAAAELFFTPAVPPCDMSQCVYAPAMTSKDWSTVTDDSWEQCLITEMILWTIMQYDDGTSSTDAARIRMWDTLLTPPPANEPFAHLTFSETVQQRCFTNLHDQTTGVAAVAAFLKANVGLKTPFVFAAQTPTDLSKKKDPCVKFHIPGITRDIRVCDPSSTVDRHYKFLTCTEGEDYWPTVINMWKAYNVGRRAVEYKNPYKYYNGMKSTMNTKLPWDKMQCAHPSDAQSWRTAAQLQKTGVGRTATYCASNVKAGVVKTPLGCMGMETEVKMKFDGVHVLRDAAMIHQSCVVGLTESKKGVPSMLYDGVDMVVVANAPNKKHTYQPQAWASAPPTQWVPKDTKYLSAFANTPKLQDSGACDCGGSNILYKSNGMPEGFVPPIYASVLGVWGTLSNVWLYEFGYGWEINTDKLNGELPIGLYIPSNPGYTPDLTLHERDVLDPGTGDPTPTVNRFFTDARVPGYSDLELLLFDGTIKPNTGFTHKTVQFKYGACMRYPYGQIPAMGMDPAERAKYYPNQSADKSTFYVAEEALHGYCEMRNNRLFHCMHDPLSTNGRRAFCARDISKRIVVGPGIRAQTIGSVCNLNPTTPAERVCLVVSGAPTFGSADSVLSHPNTDLTNYTILYTPFNWTIVSGFLGPGRQWHTPGGGMTHGQLLHDLGDNETSSTGMAALTDAEFGLFVNETQFTVEETQALVGTIAQKLLLGECAQNVSCQFLPWVDPINNISYNDIFQNLSDYGTRVNYPGITVASAWVDKPLTFVRSEALYGVGQPCTQFFVSAPRFTIDAIADQAGCENMVPLNRAVVVFGGADVSGAHVRVSTYNSEMPVVVVGDDTTEFIDTPLVNIDVMFLSVNTTATNNVQYAAGVARTNGTVKVRYTGPGSPPVIIQPIRWTANTTVNLTINTSVVNISKYTNVFGDAVMRNVYAEHTQLQSRALLPVFVVLVTANVILILDTFLRN
jgi:hypothetical protein